MQKHKILIVDDDQGQRYILKKFLKELGHITESATYHDALSKIKSTYFDLALVDLSISTEFDGIDLIEPLKSKLTYVIILTSCNNSEIIDKCNTLGCNDYFQKIINKEIIEKNILEAINNYMIRKDDLKIEEFINNNYPTQDPDTIQSFKYLFHNLNSQKPILLTGPTGSGKTLLASKIHNHLGSKGEFVNVNVNSIPEHLIPSSFFGSKKGSYSGSNKDTKGFFELANNGTLFLDEIGSISLETQNIILKAIDEKKFYPLGAEKPISINFNLISATSESLNDKVYSQKMRLDFLRRISHFEIYLPGIKDRIGDLPILFKYFSKDRKKLTFSSGAKHLLNNYHWPYNLAEISELFDYLITLGKGLIKEEDISTKIKANSSSYINNSKCDFLTIEQFNYSKTHGLNNLIEKIKQEAIVAALNENKNNVRQAIKLLQIHNNQYYNIKKLMEIDKC